MSHGHQRNTDRARESGGEFQQQYQNQEKIITRSSVSDSIIEREKFAEQIFPFVCGLKLGKNSSQ